MGPCAIAHRSRGDHYGSTFARRVIQRAAGAARGPDRALLADEHAARMLEAELHSRYSVNLRSIARPRLRTRRAVVDLHRRIEIDNLGFNTGARFNLGDEV